VRTLAHNKNSQEKNVKRFIFTAFVATAAILSVPSESRSTPKPNDISTDLVVGAVSTQEDPYGGWIGVRVRLGPGWKIYWKSPGDTGAPSEFDWSASSNLVTATVQWPKPHRTSILGVESVGYTDEVVFPVKIQLLDPDLNSDVELKFTLFACSTICIREDRVLKAALSHPSALDAQALIDEWRDKVPTERSASLSIQSIDLAPSMPPTVRIEALSDHPLRQTDLFVASSPAGIYAGKPKIESTGGRTIMTAPLEGDRADIDRASSIEVTVVAESGALAKTISLQKGHTLPTTAKAGGGDSSRGSSWWSIIFITWIGGLILNLMPCVFPVLSLKLLVFVRAQTPDKRELRVAFIVSALGVVASFLTLASALVALRAAGATIGWGLQFQEPIFLAAMAVAVSLFAANLLGLFEVSLPTALTNILPRLGMTSSVPSHFASGFVATLLATPCSAPFVGTAVAFALSRGPLEIIGIFGTLGLGMATPYLLAACVPNLANFLPRPGPWLLWLKRALALPLLGTAGWLVWIVAETAGPLPALGLGALLLIGFVALWWRTTRPPRDAVIACLYAAAVVAGMAVILDMPVRKPAATERREVSWRQFDELDSLVRSGRTVFLDITADWCVTCKVNKTFVINDPQISSRLSRDVVPVRADLTRPNARIAEYLKSFGRYGIPFNVVFGPNAPDGIVLPEILTKATVLSAFANSSIAPHPIQKK
jgi:suppressor for copper-sensitivity B